MTPVRSRLTPRALALAGVAVVLMAVMVQLGRWQYGVYDDHQRADAEVALHRPPVPLSSVLGRDQAFPADAVSRPVTVLGRFLAGQQVFVRNLPGATGRYAVATPLVTADGSAMLVVRGSSDSLAAPAPAGQVAVRGILEPSADGGTPPNAQRVVRQLSIPSVVGAIGPDLYSGYVVLQASTPPEPAGLSPVPPPLPDPSRWAGLRNLLYACQWWLFAGFVAFMWWRMTTDVAASPADEVPSDAEVASQV